MKSPAYIYAVVAQSVERFLGKEEVRQFKSAQQLQSKPPSFRICRETAVLLYPYLRKSAAGLP